MIFTARNIKAQNILEIGTAIGYSRLFLAHVPVPGFNDGFPAHLDLVDAGQAQAFVRAQKRQGCFLPVRRARGALSVRAKVCFFAAPQWFFTQVCRDRPLLRAYSARGRCECGSLT